MFTRLIKLHHFILLGIMIHMNNQFYKEKKFAVNIYINNLLKDFLNENWKNNLNVK